MKKNFRFFFAFLLVLATFAFGLEDKVFAQDRTYCCNKHHAISRCLDNGTGVEYLRCEEVTNNKPPCEHPTTDPTCGGGCATICCTCDYNCILVEDDKDASTCKKIELGIKCDEIICESPPRFECVEVGSESVCRPCSDPTLRNCPYFNSECPGSPCDPCIKDPCRIGCPNWCNIRVCPENACDPNTCPDVACTNACPQNVCNTDICPNNNVCTNQACIEILGQDDFCVRCSNNSNCPKAKEGVGGQQPPSLAPVPPAEQAPE